VGIETEWRKNAMRFAGSRVKVIEFDQELKK
jgi:hypothetical protein